MFSYAVMTLWATHLCRCAELSALKSRTEETRAFKWATVAHLNLSVTILRQLHSPRTLVTLQKMRSYWRCWTTLCSHGAHCAACVNGTDECLYMMWLCHMTWRLQQHFPGMPPCRFPRFSSLSRPWSTLNRLDPNRDHISLIRSDALKMFYYFFADNMENECQYIEWHFSCRLNLQEIWLNQFIWTLKFVYDKTLFNILPFVHHFVCNSMVKCFQWLHSKQRSYVPE